MTCSYTDRPICIRRCCFLLHSPSCILSLYTQNLYICHLLYSRPNISVLEGFHCECFCLTQKIRSQILFVITLPDKTVEKLKKKKGIILASSPCLISNIFHYGRPSRSHHFTVFYFDTINRAGRGLLNRYNLPANHRH